MTTPYNNADRIVSPLTNWKQKLAARLQLAVAARPSWEGTALPVLPGTVLQASQTPLRRKKVCIFAQFQAEGGVDQAMLRYLQALQAHRFYVILVSTSVLAPEATAMPAPYCHTIIQRENTGFDFASWKCATDMLPETLEAEELLLTNDSVLYLGDIANVFSIMDAVTCDFWGMTVSLERRFHLQSYFLCLRPRVLQHPSFLNFWRKVAVLGSQKFIIRRYESALTLRLLLAGLRGAAFIPPHWLPDGGLNNPTLTHGDLLCRYFGMPFLKKKLLKRWKNESIMEVLHKVDYAHDVVDILLPTYNGEQYCSTQLESLRRQSGVRFRILVRDDASIDGTRTILESFAAEHPDMRILHGERLGVVGNLGILLSESETEGAASYFALADQDDCWYPHKLRTLYDAMKTLESRHGKDVPLLVCSDARCVDGQGLELHPSFLRLMGIPADWETELRNVLVMSPALGCSCMGNAALRRMAVPLPEGDAIFMHDWWLALIAACFGSVHCLRRPLLDYRRHTGNILGARGRSRLTERLCGINVAAARTQKQAATFLRNFGEKMTHDQCVTIFAWANMPMTPHVLRLWHCRKERFGKPGLRWFVS